MLVLLFVVAVNLVVFVFVWRLDGFVHGDLYAYGLVFSRDWADEYWNCSWMLWIFLGGATVLAAISIIPHFLHSKEPSRFSKWTGFLLSIVALVYQGIGIMYLNQINGIVWNKLYDYGVRYDIAWSATYNPISMPALALMVIALLALIIPAVRAFGIIEIEIEWEDD